MDNSEDLCKTLSLLHEALGIATMQCDAHNAECWALLTANEGHSYPHLNFGLLQITMDILTVAPKG
jgi:hypothetical protein